MEALARMDATAAIKGRLTLIDHSSEVTALKDIEVPEKFFHRMLFGVPVLDQMFGGNEFPGIMPGTSILFTGMPGGGKSTVALQFADLLQKFSGRNILYNVGEESSIMVTLRGNRIGISGEFGVGEIADVGELIRTCRDTGVEFLVQDSLQSLSDDEFPNLSGKALWRQVAKKLHKFAKDDGVTVLVIGHITKGGDFAGYMETKHDLDVHAHIKLNKEEMGGRIFEILKNRFGPAGIPYECTLTDKGMDFHQMEVSSQVEEGKSKQDERRDAIKKLIKDALLGSGEFEGKPEKISAYCLTRFKDPLTGRMGVDCSGGHWRSLVDRVANELRAEGHVVSTAVISNRSHFYVEI